MKDYYSEYNSLKKMVKRLKRNIEDLNEYVKLNIYIDRKTVINLIQEIILLIIDKKKLKGIMYKNSSYLSEFSKDSNSIEIIEVRE